MSQRISYLFWGVGLVALVAFIFATAQPAIDTQAAQQPPSVILPAPPDPLLDVAKKTARYSEIACSVKSGKRSTKIGVIVTCPAGPSFEDVLARAAYITPTGLYGAPGWYILKVDRPNGHVTYEQWSNSYFFRLVSRKKGKVKKERTLGWHRCKSEPAPCPA